MPRRAKPMTYQQVQGRRSCKLCQLKLADPAKLDAIEHRLALGEGFKPLAEEYGLTADAVTRHWRRHCDAKAVLRRVHRKDGDADVEELLLRGQLSGTGPMTVADRQIKYYVSEFQDCRERGDRDARDSADRRLFQWVRLKHRMLTPLAQQYGPQQVNNVTNNTLVAAGPDFGQLFEEFERRLALHPEKRGEAVALLREGGLAQVIDADAAE